MKMNRLQLEIQREILQDDIEMLKAAGAYDEIPKIMQEISRLTKLIKVESSRRKILLAKNFAGQNKKNTEAKLKK